MIRRLNALRRLMQADGIDVLLVAGRADIRYISGFSCSRGLCLIMEDRCLLAVDFRYLEQAQCQVENWEIIRAGASSWSGLLADTVSGSMKTVRFEPGGISYLDYREIVAAAGEADISPSDGLIPRLRMIKDESETERIKQAQSIAERAFSSAVQARVAGMTEREIAAEIDCAMLRGGAEAPSFATIVAGGEHSSMPHAVTGRRVTAEADNVLIDWGALAYGYNSDSTRTLFCDRSTTEMAQIYDIVREAQERAIEALKPGRACRDIDALAREFIASKGYGDYFGHGLGHGVGLEVHEGPVLNPASRDVLQAGMVITVEPGIYLPGKGGVRIEDLLLITEKGAENLTGLSKERIIV